MMLKIEADTGKLDASLKKADEGVRKLEASVKIGGRTMRAAVNDEEQLSKALEKFEGAAVKAATAQQRKAAASLAAQKSSALLKQLTDQEREAVQELTRKEQARLSLAKQKSAALLAEMTATQNAAKAADKKAASDRAAAAASLARQKSTAILSQLMEKEAEIEKRGRIALLSKDTLRRAVTEAEEASHIRTQKRLADMAQTQEKQGSAWKRGATAAMGYAATLTGIGTAAAGAAVLIRTLTADQENMIAKADRSNQSAKGLKEFIALQAEGEAGKALVKDAVLKGAAAGVSAENVGKMAQPIQSVVDANGDGALNAEERKKFDEDFGAALTLQKIGVGAEDASTVITANRTKGIGGSVAADKLIAAADKSVGGPADFARAGAAINQFENTDTGLAVATALTAEGTPLEQLPTLVRGAALTLGSANDESEFSKKFGLVGLSEEEKIAKLREEGKKRGKGATEEERIADFSRSFKSKEGGSLDEEKARAMGLLVRQGGMFNSTLEAVRAAEGSGLAEQKAAALAADPLAGSAMRSDAAAALQTAGDMYGVGSDKARDKRDRALARAAALKQYGGDIALDPSTGLEKNPYLNPIDAARGYAAARSAGMPEKYVQGSENMNGQDMLRAAMEGLQKSLDANTAATQANSTASKTTKAVGGAASNAEEKY